MINIAGYVMGLTFIISHVGHLNLEVMGDNNLTISLILAHGWTAMLQLCTNAIAWYKTTVHELGNQVK